MSVYNTCEGRYFSPYLTRDLIARVCAGEGVSDRYDIHIIFVDDAAITELNQEFLHKDDVTDVIAFDLSESDAALEGEVYVCLTQAVQQAEEYGTDFENETSRLVIHGVLHLLGHLDGTELERDGMHRLENRYLGISGTQNQHLSQYHESLINGG